MKSNNATDSDFRQALSEQLSHLLPAEGWQQKVLAEMARKRRRRLRLRWITGASVAAAVALLFIMVPSKPSELTESSELSDPSEFIYSREYYAAIPRPERPISEELDMLIGISDISSSVGDYYEPYTPLPL